MITRQLERQLTRTKELARRVRALESLDARSPGEAANTSAYYRSNGSLHPPGNVLFDNNTALYWRNAADSADTLLIRYDTINRLLLGNISGDHTAVIIFAPGSFNNIAIQANNGDLNLREPVRITEVQQPQLEIEYDASNSADFTVTSLGYLGIEPTGGRVGIGTAAPVTLLDVAGSGPISLTVQSTDNTAALRLFSGAVTASVLWLVYTEDADGSFRVYDDTNERTVLELEPGAPSGSLYVAADGDVGLGTAAPTAALDVLRSGAAAQILARTTVSGTASLKAASAGGQEILLRADTADSYIDAGQFGIGIRAPAHDLHISGATTVSVGMTEEDTTQKWRHLVTGNAYYLEPEVNDSVFRIRNVANVDIFTVNTTSDRVGIGTSSPGRALQVTQADGSDNTWISTIAGTTSAVCGLLMGDSGSDAQGQVRYDNSGDFMAFYTGNTERMRIDAGGDLAIGNIVGNYRLDVHDSGALYVANFFGDGNTNTNHGIIIQAGADTNPSHFVVDIYDGNGTRIGSIAGDGAGGTNYNQTSDASAKEDVKDLAGALGTVLQLRPVDYRGAGAGPGGRRQVGLIAQEVQTVAPALVAQPPDDGPLGLDYSRLVPYLIGAVQELEARIAALEATA